MVFIKRASYIIVLFLSKCLVLSAKYKTSEYIVYADQIRERFIQEMEQKYGCVCIGSGGRMPHNIETLQVDLVWKRRATIEEARALEVFAVEKFTAMINTDENIRPYLCEFPFPPHRAQVTCSFYTPFEILAADGSIAYISQIRGKLFYSTKDPFTGDFVSLIDEPYEEAKKKLEIAPIKNPFTHQSQPYESLMDKIVIASVNELQKRYNLHCESIGGKLMDGIDEVGARFIYFHPTQIEKARELQVVVTEKLIEAINSNEQLRPYIKNYPISTAQLRVSVLFRKSNYYPYFDGTLDSVTQEGDKVVYLIEPDYDDTAECFAIPMDLSVFAQESYHEAAQKVRETRRGKKLKIHWHLDKETIETTSSPKGKKVEK